MGVEEGQCSVIVKVSLEKHAEKGTVLRSLQGER